jgi:hypothetical protein
MRQLIEKFLVFGPLGVLVGVAAAALSLTSWAIMLPIMLQFNVSVQGALFTCFIIDFVNGSFLVYRYRNFVDTKGGAVLGLLAGAVAVSVALGFGKKFITSHDKLLKGGVAFSDFLGGIVFAMRAWKTREVAGNAEEEEAEDAAKQALMSTESGEAEEYDLPRNRRVSGRLGSRLSNRPPSSFVVSAAALVNTTPLNSFNFYPLNSPPAIAKQQEEVETGFLAVRLLQELQKPFTKQHFSRIFIVFGATVFVGAICGVIGFGAGT